MKRSKVHQMWLDPEVELGDNSGNGVAAISSGGYRGLQR